MASTATDAPDTAETAEDADETTKFTIYLVMPGRNRELRRYSTTGTTARDSWIAAAEKNGWTLDRVVLGGG